MISVDAAASSNEPSTQANAPMEAANDEVESRIEIEGDVADSEGSLIEPLALTNAAVSTNEPPTQSNTPMETALTKNW